MSELDASLREHMKLTHGSLKELETLATSQNALMSRTYQNQQRLKTSYADIVRGSCAELAASVKKAQQPSQTTNVGPQAAQEISGMIDNFMDKEKRNLNIVIFNLPGQGHADDSAASGIQKDISLFCNIIKEELRLNVKVIKGFRVGRKTANRPRLLIATLDSIETKLEALSNGLSAQEVQ